MKSTLCSVVILALSFLGSCYAEEKAKVVFIFGSPSHGRMKHEHRAGNIILADALNQSGLDVEAVLVPHFGYPKDKSILDNAATIVIFCTGHRGHVLKPHLGEFDALMKKGAGVVMIHWATEAEKGKPGKKFLEWMGSVISTGPSMRTGRRILRISPITQSATAFSRFALTTNGITTCGLSRT
jgi:hypothetical protein